MTKPIINAFSPVEIPSIHRYKRYLPTTFDESLSILQKMNKVIKALEALGEVTTDVIEQWNAVMQWIEDEGLTEEVRQKLEAWLADGTLAQLLAELTNTGYVDSETLGMLPNTDITSTLQAVLNSGVLKIKFKTGVYNLSSVIELPTGTDLLLDKNTRFVRTGSDLYLFLNGVRGKLDYAVGQSANGSIQIKGGIFDLNTKGNPPINTTDNAGAFYFGLGDDIEASDFEIREGQNGHYFQISGCTNTYIHDFKVNNQWWTDTSNGSHEAVQVEAFTTASFPYFAQVVATTTISNHVRIEDGYFENVIRAVGTHGYTLDSNNLPIQNKNIFFKRLRGFNILDCAVTLYGYQDFVVEDCQFDTVGGHAFLTQYSDDGRIKHNKFSSVSKTLIQFTNTKRCEFTYNTGVDVGLNITTAFSAIRVSSFSHKNIIQYNRLINTSGAKYSSPIYFSDSTENIIGGNEYDFGLSNSMSGDIAGTSSTDLENQCWTGGTDRLLFDGDLNTVGSSYDFTYTPKACKAIVIIANAYESSNHGYRTSLYLPNCEIDIGSPTSRYRLLVDPVTNAYIEFHIEAVTLSNGKNCHRLIVDAVTGIARIRQIVGVK